MIGPRHRRSQLPVQWVAWATLLTLIVCRGAPSTPGGQDRFLPTTHQVTTAAHVVATPRGPVRAWLYRPEGLTDVPTIVLVHGVHRDGADEARLRTFAHTLAAAGLMVLTPHIQSLADYRIEQDAIEIIGWSAKTLRRRFGRRVGVMGLSFAGGLCLMAAADRRFAPEIGYVLAVGAHDDLQRVTRFLLTNEIRTPQGETVYRKADPYGVLLLAYTYVEAIFPPTDREAGRMSLRFQLWGQPDQARLAAERMSPAGQAIITKLFEGDCAAVSPMILSQVAQRTAALRAVSPHHVLKHIHCPVFLVHGANDAVIPPSETQWLAQALGDRCRVLVTLAVGHVEVTAAATAAEKLEVAQFLGSFLAQARTIR